MKTYAYEGIRVPYSNTGSAIASGDVVVLVSGTSGYIGIAVDAIAATTGTGVLEVRRAHTLTKKSGDVFTAGQTVYWNSSSKYLTTTSSGNTRAGRSDGAYASAATSATILLNQA